MGTTVVITVVIVVIWLSTNRVLTFSNPETTTVQVIDAPGPFDAVKNSFSQFSDNFSKNVDELKTKFSTSDGVETPPPTRTIEESTFDPNSAQ